jgi:hypothetical protein
MRRRRAERSFGITGSAPFSATKPCTFVKKNQVEDNRVLLFFGVPFWRFAADWGFFHNLRDQR